MDDKKQVLILRIFIVVFVVISAFIAINKDKLGYIADMMGISWGALAGAFLAPFMYGLYSKNITKAAVWASYIVGVGITVSNMFLKFIASPINAGAVAMVAGMIVVPVVSWLTPKMKKVVVEDAFSCLEEKVLVSKKKSIEE